MRCCHRAYNYTSLDFSFHPVRPLVKGQHPLLRRLYIAMIRQYRLRRLWGKIVFLFRYVIRIIGIFVFTTIMLSDRPDHAGYGRIKLGFGSQERPDRTSESTYRRSTEPDIDSAKGARRIQG